jgi:hypothetical protein
MLACDTSIAPHEFASDKSYFGQPLLDGRGVAKATESWIKRPFPGSTIPSARDKPSRCLFDRAAPISKATTAQSPKSFSRTSQYC